MTILIADDDQYSAVLLQEWLAGNHTKIHIVTKGNDAVAYCKTNPVDIVLMDIKLPEMDGIEAAKQIKKYNPNIFIIAQTACINEFEFPNDYFNAYFLKPLIREDLLRYISKAVF